ncbi:MAG TPA: glycosyltransferase family 4 protein [Rubricoccaceae bacterium]|nr:glycosyltransferase family 4 protein [Rubricoccaceae bacterium]
MRILSNDFGGYPYPVQLARALARRGHTVLHTYCASLQTTPQGTLAPLPDDPSSVEVKALRLREPLEKYAFVKRWRQEREYGRLVAAEVARFRPDVVLSANTPLDAQQMLAKATRAHGARFVFWLQDVIGIAAERILKKKLPGVGALVGKHYVRLEASQLRRSDAVVPITDDFRAILRDWGVDEARVTTVENWAPLEELPLAPPDNAWARTHGLDRAFVFLYAGTLALKHNPDLLLQLALRVRDRGARVVVLSQGPGADWLREQKAAHGLDTLDVLGFKPFAEMPDAFAAADVLVAVLEPDAGVFSVPSKVLAYFCGGRPILLAVPPENLAARLVAQREAGFVVPPDDTAGFLAAADRLLDEAALREAMGRNARTYAEEAFDIERITDRFEAILQEAASL